MQIINIADIKWLTRHYQDPLGFVFRYGRRIFRIINKNKEDEIRELIESEMISEAINKGYLIDTWISENMQLEGYEGRLLLEHKFVSYITYEHEWSYRMFLYAAQHIINFNLFLLERGYELFDPSPGNVEFEGCRPVYVDLGSIVKADKTDLSNSIVFRNTWLNPLKMMKMMEDDRVFINHMLALSEFGTDRYLKVDKRGTIRYIGIKVGDFIRDVENRIIYTESYSGRHDIELIRKIAKKISHITPQRKLEKKKHQFRYLNRNIQKFNNNSVKEYWTDYHNELINKDGSVKADQRIEYYVMVIRQLKDRDNNIDSIFEIAGNSGAVSQALIEAGVIHKACVSDYDSGAIDRGWTRCHNLANIKGNISFAVLDLMNYFELGRETKYFRFKSDVVVALAVMHHLLLAQKVRMDILVDYLYDYTNKYLITEFMPLGLWDGSSKDPGGVPHWYTLEWFLECIRKKFTVLKVEKIRKNRIAVIAEKR